MTGSIKAIINTDESGAITDRYDYTPYGSLISHTGIDLNRIMFSSEPNDEESGLVYLRSRYYSKTNGRFLSKDKLSDLGKNRYPYAKNNPIMYYDPNGLLEMAYGVGGTYIKWNHGNYRRLRISKNLKYKDHKKIEEAIEEYYNNRRGSTPHGHYGCFYWRDDFILDAPKRKAPTLGNLKAILRRKGIDVVDIVPYGVWDTRAGWTNQKHEWVYIRIVIRSYSSERGPVYDDVWWFTESNAQFPKYSSYQVKAPDTYPIWHP